MSLSLEELHKSIVFTNVRLKLVPGNKFPMVMFASLSAGLGSIWSGFVPDVRLGETDTSLYCPIFPLLATTLLISAATNISVVLTAKIPTGGLLLKFGLSGAKKCYTKFDKVAIK